MAQMDNTNITCDESVIQTENVHTSCTEPIVQTKNDHSNCTEPMVQTENAYTSCTESIGQTDTDNINCDEPRIQTKNVHTSCTDPIVQTENAYKSCTQAMGQTDTDNINCDEPRIQTKNVHTSCTKPMVQTENDYTSCTEAMDQTDTGDYTNCIGEAPTAIVASKHPFRNQLLACFWSSLNLAGVMSVWAQTSSVLPQITKDSNSQPYLSQNMASWFSSLPMLMAIPGSLLGGWLIEHLGPRRFQLITGPMLMASAVLLSLTGLPNMQNIIQLDILLMAVRFLQSILVAIMNPVFTIYPCEIGDIKHRGMLTGMIDAYATFSFILSYALGGVLVWFHIVWIIPAITLVPGFLGLLFSAPESPVWLTRKNREADAKKVLCVIRGSEEAILDEINDIRKYSQNSEKESFFENLKKICNLPHLKALTASTVTIILKEFNGNFAIILFTVQIFDMAGTGMNPFLSSVIVGCVKLVASLFCSILLLHAPRKVLLCIGNLFLSLSTIAIGYFFYIKENNGDVSDLGWLPMTGIMCFTIVFSISVGPVAWLVATEILPNNIRNIGSGFTYTGYSLGSFIISKSFIDLVEIWGIHWVFWAYSICTVVYIIFIFLVIPETKGLTLSQIEEYWKVGKS